MVNAAIVVFTIRGLIVAGFFPAVAAAAGTYRRWLLSDEKRWGIIETWRCFSALWHSEMPNANSLGYALAAAWTLVLFDYRVLTVMQLGVIGPFIAGILIVVALFLLLVTAVIWPVRATFAESTWWQVRYSANLILARPLCSLALTAEFFIVLWGLVYYPAIVVTAGPSALLFITTVTVFAFGHLPRPGESQAREVHVPELVSSAPTNHLTQEERSLT